MSDSILPPQRPPKNIIDWMHDSEVDFAREQMDFRARMFYTEMYQKTLSHVSPDRKKGIAGETRESKRNWLNIKRSETCESKIQHISVE